MLRCGELASIDFQSVAFSESDASFRLTKPRKSQHSGPLQVVSIGRWLEDDLICPVLCLHNYIQATSAVRSPSNSQILLIGSTRPHKPVGSSTVARWIKSQLEAAGINTTIFGAHSTRGAAGSKANTKGVNIQSILARGHWSRETTFSKFYQRATVDRLVEKAVLST